jgi:hypothetical protein
MQIKIYACVSVQIVDWWIALFYELIGHIICCVEKYTFWWTWFLAIHVNLSITTHTVSIWLGVGMSIVRFIYIKSMGIGKVNIDQARSVLVVVLVFVISMLIYIPAYSLTKTSKYGNKYARPNFPNYYQNPCSKRFYHRHIRISKVIIPKLVFCGRSISRYNFR